MSNKLNINILILRLNLLSVRYKDGYRVLEYEIRLSEFTYKIDI